MKTCILGFLFLGLTNLLHSQNEVAAVSVDLSTYEIPVRSTKIAKNDTYANSVNTMVASERIKKFQTLVANYDIKDSNVYIANKPLTYTVVFKEGENTIKALYDRSGTIIRCEETFQNVRLPHAIGVKLSKEHPGWSFHEVMCNVDYDSNALADVKYKVALKKGSKIKTVTLNTQSL